MKYKSDDQVMRTLGARPVPPVTGTSCPNDEALRRYHDQFSARIPHDEMSPDLREIAGHALECDRCFVLLEKWADQHAESRMNLDTAILRENPNDAKHLAGVMADDARPAWLRAMAADYLGALASEQARVALTEASRDPDEEVREAATYALDEVNRWAAKLQRWAADVAANLKLRLDQAGRLPIGQLAPAAVLSAASAGENEVLRQGVLGTGSGELRWELQRDDDEVWLSLESRDPALEGETALVFISDADAAEPSVRQDFLLKTIGQGRIGGLHFLGKLADIALTGNSELDVILTRRGA